jgi:hypothetical protein
MAHGIIAAIVLLYRTIDVEFAASGGATNNFQPMDDSFHQQIERARQMSGDEKVRESLQLFQRTSRLMLDGLRNEYPKLSEPQLLEKLYERLAFNRQLERVGAGK